jgi:hypothetical protein
LIKQHHTFTIVTKCPFESAKLSRQNIHLKNLQVTMEYASNNITPTTHHLERDIFALILKFKVKSYFSLVSQHTTKMASQNALLVPLQSGVAPCSYMLSCIGLRPHPKSTCCSSGHLLCIMQYTCGTTCHQDTLANPWLNFLPPFHMRTMIATSANTSGVVPFTCYNQNFKMLRK